MTWISILIATGLPSTILSIIVAVIQKRIFKKLEDADARRTQAREEAAEAEKRREMGQIMLIDSINASIKLSETIATGCKKSGMSGFNGNVEDALMYAREIREKQNKYYRDTGISQIYN